MQVKATIVRITPHELMRMKDAVIDSDRDAALDIIRDLLNRAETESHGGHKNHLDK